MNAEAERLTAAQAKADAVIAAVREPHDSVRLLRVTVVDVDTNEVLALDFVSYDAPPALRLVES
ncbi:hypothetical protein [Streptomyces griseofuscus]|uniref:Uncharacterized protein n=1 Tax=Streptomyces griseofuscus TaxID=146922 RepID=A0A3R8QCN5_9ACTN|nr:hypothetical protein [Streptomyces griseofuscus]RRQ81535.1 hypothetical protein CQW44_30505 [Streptomyces griseofuscus]